MLVHLHLSACLFETCCRLELGWAFPSWRSVCQVCTHPPIPPHLSLHQCSMHILYRWWFIFSKYMACSPLVFFIFFFQWLFTHCWASFRWASGPKGSTEPTAGSLRTIPASEWPSSPWFSDSGWNMHHCSIRRLYIYSLQVCHLALKLLLLSPALCFSFLFSLMNEVRGVG